MCALTCGGGCLSLRVMKEEVGVEIGDVRELNEGGRFTGGLWSRDMILTACFKYTKILTLRIEWNKSESYLIYHQAYRLRNIFS